MNETIKYIPKDDRCHFCKKEATLLCDRPNNKVISHSKGFGFSTHNFTCDKKICTNCTTRIDGFDYCPDCIAKIKSAQKGVEEC